MQALSCALLVAAANGFYSPQQKAMSAPRVLARAAKEGQAAAGEKKRIVQRSVVKTRQPHQELQIYDDSQQRAQQFPPKQNARRTQVVVGNGMVGQRLVELCADKLEERGASDQVDIVSFCEERLAAYNRVRLTSWFETRDADDLSLVGS